MNPTCIDLVHEWVKRTFPSLKIRFADFGRQSDVPLALYVDDIWVVSIQYYEGVHQVSAWNVSGNQNYIMWADPADPEFFSKLEDFVKMSVGWFEALTPSEKNKYRIYRLGG